MATASLVSRYAEDKRRTIVNRDCLSSHLQSVTKQLLLVSLIGPYQTGKSSFISHLTGERLAEVGNGNEDETKGVWIFGPYDLNALKRRWGVPEIDGDEAKVAFIDTEGFGGAAGKTNDENRFVMCELVAPYLAISQVSILMHSTKFEKGSQETLKFVLEVVERICSGANSGKNGMGNMKIVDLSVRLANYHTGEVNEDGEVKTFTYRPDKDPNKFQQACEYLRRIQSKRLGMDGTQHLLIDKFWPLPVFDDLSSISQQNEIFNSGFTIVAKELLKLLDEIKACHFITGEGAFAAFDMFQSNLTQENLQELAQKARELAELNTVERILQPSVDAIVNATKSSIETHIALLKGQLSGPDCTYETPDDARLGFDQIVSEALEKINQVEGLSSSNRKSDKWQELVSEANAKLVQAKNAAKIEYMNELEPYQIKLIVSDVLCFLADESTKIIVQVVRIHEDKRTVDADKIDQFIKGFEKTRDEKLSIKCKELHVSPETARKCRENLSNDFKQYTEKLTESARDIVNGNKEAYQKRCEELIKFALDQAGTLLKEFATTGGEILKAKFMQLRTDAKK